MIADYTREDIVRGLKLFGQRMRANPERYGRPLRNQTRYSYTRQPDKNPFQRLLLDARLTPLDRNGWQALHYLLTDQGRRYPVYEDLQPFLVTTPGIGKASRETVARVLLNLRLTRWLSLLTNVHDAQGKLQPLMYVLHDDPLTPAEALRQNDGYGELIQHSLKHAAKGVRDLAQHVLGELRRDRSVPAELMPKLLSLVPTVPEQHALALDSASHESAQRSVAQVRTFESTKQDSEPGPPTQQIRAVRNPPCTVQEPMKQRSTEPRASDTAELHWPAGVVFSASEQRTLNKAMAPLTADARRAVLQEAVARCSTGTVRRPAAYLMGLIRKAIEGDFRLWAARDTGGLPVAQCTAPYSAESSTANVRTQQAVAAREASPIALECLEHLRRRVGLRSSP